MSFGFFHFKHCAVTLALALSGAGFAGLRAADGRPIEFSPIDGQPAGTNLIQIGSPRSGPMNYLDRIGRSGGIEFRSVSPDFMPASTPGTVSRIRRNRQSDRLGPATPEEVINNYIAKEILKTPDSDSDSDTGWSSLLQRFNERLWLGRADTNSPSPDALSELRDARKGWHWSGPDRVASSEGETPTLKALLTDSGGDESPVTRPITLSDVFGPTRSSDATADAVVARKAQQEQVDAFKKVIDFQPSARSDSLGPIGVPAAAVPAPAGGWAGSPPPNAFGSLPGLTAPSFTPNVPTASTAPGVFSATAPSGYLPTTPPPAPKRLTPPQPVFSVPQRQF